jgi:hypothetical protein
VITLVLVRGVEDPQSGTDAVNKRYVDDRAFISSSVHSVSSVEVPLNAVGTYKFIPSIFALNLEQRFTIGGSGGLCTYTGSSLCPFHVTASLY